MKGVVEVYRGEEKILEESNMLMDNLGSQIAFWMTLPRGFGDIPSASAIYDTSNYTVRAASLGKDAAGYAHHAHREDMSTLTPTDNELFVFSYDGSSVSAYHTSSFAFQDNKIRYEVLPEFSHPKMQRLEEKSTDVFGIDLGQNLNAIFLTERMGCYAPSGQVTYSVLSSLPVSVNNAVISVQVNNNNGFNSQLGQTNKAIDIAGFIKNNVADIAEGRLEETAKHYYKGLLISYDNDSWNQNGLYSIKHVIGLVPADLLALNFFGGVYTIGLWGYDVQGMIKKGKYPPYTNYPTNNWEERAEYKLIARKTFTFDLTQYQRLDQVTQEVKIIWRFNFP